MKTRVAIVGVVTHAGKILLLKRSPEKRYSPNLWEFVGGFLQEEETTQDCVLREVLEETGLNGRVERRGAPFESQDPWGDWIVIPHEVSVDSDKVVLSREHTEYRWIFPQELKNYECVVNAKKDLEALQLI